MTHDPFDPEYLRLEQKLIVKQPKSRAPAAEQRRKGHFIRMPMAWFDKLEGQSAATHRLALWLLYEHWRANDRRFLTEGRQFGDFSVGVRPIRVSNKGLDKSGISRWAKYRSLTTLDKLGLIEVVEKQPRRSPIVRVLL